VQESVQRQLLEAQRAGGLTSVSKKDFLTVARLVQEEVRRHNCKTAQKRKRKKKGRGSTAGTARIEKPVKGTKAYRDAKEQDACGCSQCKGWSRRRRPLGCSRKSMDPKCGCSKGSRTNKLESAACINDGGCGKAGGTWLRDMVGDPRIKYVWLMVFNAMMRLADTMGGILCSGRRKVELDRGCCEKILNYNYQRWNKKGDIRYGGRWVWQDFITQPKGRPHTPLDVLVRNIARTNPKMCTNWAKYKNTVVNEELGEADLVQAQWGAAKKLFSKAKSVYKKVKRSVKKHVKKGLKWAKSALLGKLLKLIPSQYAWMRPIVKKFLDGHKAQAIQMLIKSKDALGFVREKLVRPMFRRTIIPTERMDCICKNTVRAGFSAGYTSSVNVCDLSPDCKSRQGRTPAETAELRKYCSLDGGKTCNNPGADPKDGKSEAFYQKLLKNPSMDGHKLWENDDYSLSTRSTVQQRRTGLDTDMQKATLLERDYGPLTMYFHKKRNDASKKVVCSLHVSIDFQLCSRICSPKSKEPYWYDGDKMVCAAQMVKKPVLSRLVYDSKLEDDACPQWFTMVDGGIRAVISQTSATHAARRTYPCFISTKERKKYFISVQK